MNKFNQCLKVIVITCVMSVVTACGQKGDLYMPEPSTSTSSYLG